MHSEDIGLQAPKRQKTTRTGKVKFLDQNDVIKLSSGNFPITRKAYVGSKNVPKIPLLTVKSNPCISPTVREKLQRNEAQKNEITYQHASHPSSSKGPTKEHKHVSDRQMSALIRNRKVQFLDLNTEKPRRDLTAKLQYIPILGSGAVVHCHRSNIEKRNIKNIPENFHNYHKHLPSSVCVWRGQFQILETITSCKVYDGFEAQPPCVVNRKAHEISKKMPFVLQLEAFPASNVLIDVFQNDPPSLQDIALYFFPSDSNDRSKVNLNCILDLLNAENSMLRCFIDGVELLLFSSTQLNEDSKGTFAAVYSEHFLWGVFRETKIANAIERL